MKGQHRVAIDSARVGASIKGRFADVIKSWRIILRLSIAPALAWWISMQVFDTQQAFFAPIAAVLTLTVAAGERVAIVFQIIIGAAFGIMIGELFIMLIGRGAWQLVLIVALAVASARFVRLPPLAVTQAVISGVLLIAIVPVNGIVDPAITRFVDALIGGLVGLAMIILIPANPIRELERGVTSLQQELADILEKIAHALRDHDESQADAALSQARGTQPLMDSMGVMSDGVTEMARISPLRWGQRATVAKLARSLVDLDHAVRNTRVLARRSAAMLRKNEKVPAGLAVALSDLANTARHDPSNADAMISAARLAIDTATQDLTVNTASIASQIRAIVADMLLAAGTPYDELDVILDFG